MVGESGMRHSKLVAKTSSASILLSTFYPQWRDIVGMVFVLKQTLEVLSLSAMRGGVFLKGHQKTGIEQAISH